MTGNWIEATHLCSLSRMKKKKKKKKESKKHIISILVHVQISFWLLRRQHENNNICFTCAVYCIKHSYQYTIKTYHHTRIEKRKMVLPFEIFIISEKLVCQKFEFHCKLRWQKTMFSFIFPKDIALFVIVYFSLSAKFFLLNDFILVFVDIADSSASLLHYGGSLCASKCRSTKPLFAVFKTRK